MFLNVSSCATTTSISALKSSNVLGCLNILKNFSVAPVSSAIVTPKASKIPITVVLDIFDIANIAKPTFLTDKANAKKDFDILNTTTPIANALIVSKLSCKNLTAFPAIITAFDNASPTPFATFCITASLSANALSKVPNSFFNPTKNASATVF